jgi:hypothetical protein
MVSLRISSKNLAERILSLGRDHELSVAADTTYGNREFLQWLADRSITPYMRTRDGAQKQNIPPSSVLGACFHAQQLTLEFATFPESTTVNRWDEKAGLRR